VKTRLLIALLVLAALVLAVGGWIAGGGRSSVAEPEPRYV
jgi:predicted small secreted protein